MVVADHLVGRVDEIRLLEHLLDEIDKGHGGLIEIVGEPGIGKTRLLRELAARAEERGHLVLTGSASELERDLPFSVFVNAADEYVGGLEPDRLILDESVLRELAQVFPTLSGLAADHDLALTQERYRSHRERRRQRQPDCPRRRVSGRRRHLCWTNRDQRGHRTGRHTCDRRSLRRRQRNHRSLTGVTLRMEDPP